MILSSKSKSVHPTSPILPKFSIASSIVRLSKEGTFSSGYFLRNILNDGVVVGGAAMVRKKAHVFYTISFRAIKKKKLWISYNPFQIKKKIQRKINASYHPWYQRFCLSDREENRSFCFRPFLSFYRDDSVT